MADASRKHTAGGVVKVRVALIPHERIERRILLVRGQKVLLDTHLARFYGVSVGRLNEAVKRNLGRFPSDFMFRLSPAEFADLKSQLAIPSSTWGGRRTPPNAFTEQGVAMLSSVLRSERAVAVNIEIMRAFVRLRQVLAAHTNLARRLEALERAFANKTKEHTAHIRQIYQLLDELMKPDEPQTRGKIGFMSEAKRED